MRGRTGLDVGVAFESVRVRCEMFSGQNWFGRGLKVLRDEERSDVIVEFGDSKQCGYAAGQ